MVAVVPHRPDQLIDERFSANILTLRSATRMLDLGAKYQHRCGRWSHGTKMVTKMVFAKGPDARISQDHPSVAPGSLARRSQSVVACLASLRSQHLMPSWCDNRWPILQAVASSKWRFRFEFKHDSVPRPTRHQLACGFRRLLEPRRFLLVFGLCGGRPWLAASWDEGYVWGADRRPLEALGGELPRKLVRIYSRNCPRVLALSGGAGQPRTILRLMLGGVSVGAAPGWPAVVCTGWLNRALALAATSIRGFSRADLACAVT